MIACISNFANDKSSFNEVKRLLQGKKNRKRNRPLQLYMVAEFDHPVWR